MCICENTGRIVIEHEWGYHFASCPNITCTHDNNAAISKFDKWAQETLRELDQLEGAAI